MSILFLPMPYKIYQTQTGDASLLQKADFVLEAPAAGEVQIEHKAIGLNFIDIYFRTGLYPWPAGSPELILGNEAAGVVMAVGAGVEGLQVGDRVVYTVTQGAYCSHRNVAASSVVHLPAEIAFEQAAGSFLKGLTTYYLLHNSFAVQSGHKVLFHAAAGGVGLIAGQWLRALGAEAIGTAGSAAKCQLARDHGFAKVINYNEQDFVERVREHTSGAGVDVVYDSVSNSTFRGSLQCLKMHGIMVSFGQSSGPYLDFKISDLAVGSFHLTRPILGHFAADRAWLERASSELFGKITSGAVRVSVNQSYDLADVAQAHNDLSARATSGSSVLIP